MNARLLFAAASLVALAMPANAQDVAITNATIVLGDGAEPVTGGTVIVREGRVVAAGADVAVPAGMTALDGSGTWITPGIFASITDIGIFDVDNVTAGNDISASGSPFSAALDVSPAINNQAQEYLVSRAGGVTRATVTLSAAETIFAGQGAVIDLGADPQPVTFARAFQFVELGERGASLAGGSRTASHAFLRNALLEARRYGEQAGLLDASAASDPRLADGGERMGDVMLNRFDVAALVPVVSGQQQLYVEVHRASDILAALALKDKFPALDMVLVGVSEGWMVAEAIAAADVPVIAVALHDLPVEFEQLAATRSNIGRMVDAGVAVALGGYNSSGDHPRNLPQQAGNLVALNKVPGATGLSWGEAFAAISSVPARIAGLGGQAGVLVPGALGDLVVWDGDPLEVSSAPVRVFIEGVEQPLDSHQSRLRERYRTLERSDLPPAYRW